MTYLVSITRPAQKEIDGLPVAEAGRVRAAIAALAENPHPHGCIKLTDRDGWRIRIGNRRDIYR